jgi:hypothetical protein
MTPAIEIAERFRDYLDIGQGDLIIPAIAKAIEDARQEAWRYGFDAGTAAAKAVLETPRDDPTDAEIDRARERMDYLFGPGWLESK